MIRRFQMCALVLVVAALGAGACAKKKVAAPRSAAGRTSPGDDSQHPRRHHPPAPPTPQPVPPTEEEVFRSKTLEQLNAEKPLTDAFFGLDSTELNDAARTALQKNVEWMKRWATTKVMVEGHADSRGTNEYNLALGERRADAVRDYIVSLGLATDRVTIVSKGEEQPFCPEDNEACWQQNRRGHFIITAK